MMRQSRLRGMIPIANNRGRNSQRVDQGPRINRDIRGYRACRLIDSDGTQLGMFGLYDAQRIADEKGLDLVEMSRDADPPVCKIMDYGKYRYEQQKKAKANRRRGQETKQMKFRCKISDADYQTKCRHIVRFLEGGNKVRVVIMFRGRELSHPERGRDILDRIAEDLKEDATVIQRPTMDTPRDMVMMLAPTKEAIARREDRRAQNQSKSGRRGRDENPVEENDE